MAGPTQDLRPIIQSLYAARNRLRVACKPLGLSFTLDGKLVGDVGEAFAAQDFGGLERLREGTKTHDFMAPGERKVQVKATQRSGLVGLGSAKQSYDYLVVYLIHETGDREVIYDGPGDLIDEERERPKRKGWYLTVKQLRKLNDQVKQADRIQRKAAPAS